MIGASSDYLIFNVVFHFVFRSFSLRLLSPSVPPFFFFTFVFLSCWCFSFLFSSSFMFLLRRIIPFVFVIFYLQSSPVPISSCFTSNLCRSLILILKYSSSITFVSFLLVVPFFCCFLLQPTTSPFHQPFLLSYCFTCSTAPQDCLPISSQSSLCRLAASH